MFVVLFCHNEAAKRALITGYSDTPSANALVTPFWCISARKQLYPWLQRVSWAANISGPISRGEPGHPSWTHLDRGFADIYRLILRAASDVQLANSEAVSRALSFAGLRTGVPDLPCARWEASL